MPTVAEKPKAKTLESFRAAFDPEVKIPNKIRTGLASLLQTEGPEGWEFEMEFCKRADVAPAVIGKYREQFAEYIVEVKVDSRSNNRKFVWFADAKIAKKARG